MLANSANKAHLEDYTCPPCRWGYDWNSDLLHYILGGGGPRGGKPYHCPSATWYRCRWKVTRSSWSSRTRASTATLALCSGVTWANCPTLALLRAYNPSWREMFNLNHLHWQFLLLEYHGPTGNFILAQNNSMDYWPQQSRPIGDRGVKKPAIREVRRRLSLGRTGRHLT